MHHSGFGLYEDRSMDPVEYERLRERIQALDDLALLDLVAFRAHEYRAEALQIAPIPWLHRRESSNVAGRRR